jgi:hypothetical protein
MTSMSNERKTPAASFQAISRAISIALSTPISSMSNIEIRVVSRCWATFTPE